jgi:uncharacterized membrane protein YdbT with pleckstrin-like domain
MRGETIVHEATISLWTQMPLILLGLILLPVFGAGLIFWLIAFIRYKSTELAVTTKRTVAKFGFISRHTIEMNLSKIETIQVTQSFLGRIFDFGSLIISGAGIPQEPIPGIGQPMEFRRAVLEAQEEATSRHEVRGASVKVNRSIYSAERTEVPDEPSSTGPSLSYRQRIIVRIAGTTLTFFLLLWLLRLLR